MKLKNQRLKPEGLFYLLVYFPIRTFFPSYININKRTVSVPSPCWLVCLPCALACVIHPALWRLPPVTYIVNVKCRLCMCYSYCNSQESLVFVPRCYPEEMFRSYVCTGESSQLFWGRSGVVAGGISMKQSWTLCRHWMGGVLLYVLLLKIRP